MGIPDSVKRVGKISSVKKTPVQDVTGKRASDSEEGQKHKMGEKGKEEVPHSKGTVNEENTGAKGGIQIQDKMILARWAYRKLGVCENATLLRGGKKELVSTTNGKAEKGAQMVKVDMKPRRKIQKDLHRKEEEWQVKKRKSNKAIEGSEEGKKASQDNTDDTELKNQFGILSDEDLENELVNIICNTVQQNKGLKANMKRCKDGEKLSCSLGISSSASPTSTSKDNESSESGSPAMDDVKVKVVDYCSQSITVEALLDGKQILLTVVYASTDHIRRRQLWQQLEGLQTSGRPWIIGGDFNSIISQEEKRGGRQYSKVASTEFNNFICQQGLQDCGFLGSTFTWCNNVQGTRRIWARLDRVLYNLEASTTFPNLKVHHLTRVSSDHSPLMVKLQGIFQGVRSFHFQRQWLELEATHKLIAEQWVGHSTAPPWVRLHMRCLQVKKSLLAWVKQNKSNRDQKIADLTEQVQNMEIQLQESWSEIVFNNFQDAQDQLIQNIKEEEGALKDKARIRWLQEGDRNSAYFHACIRERRQASRYNFQLPDGSHTDDVEVLGPMAVTYYRELLTTTKVHNRSQNGEEERSDFFSHIPCMVTEEQNNMLCKIPDWEEVQQAIKNLDPDSAPGPDGFTGHFYMGTQEVVREDLFAAITDFFRGGQIPKSSTSTVLALIPKVAQPSSFSDLRPISLCSFRYKILAKLLNDRLAKILPQVISPEQSGFVTGRSIQENIALAQEMVHEINRTVLGGNVIIKLDMSKAYDRLEWPFLMKVMRRFGFSETWVDMMFRCISNNWFTIQMQGKKFGFFKSTRGLRQGDPLSPSLFILAQEAFSRKLKHQMQVGEIGSYKGTNNFDYVSHLLYADDMIVFLNGRKRSIMNFMELLREYESHSGQQVNVAKCSFLLAKKAPPQRKHHIKRWTGFSIAELPMKYLGVPLFKGGAQRRYFDELMAKITGRISNWKNRFLSHGGKLVLIKSVLSSIPIHCLSVTKVPKLVLKEINKTMSEFLWSHMGKHRAHWVGWDKACRPMDEGGLGIRDIATVMESLQVKMAWNYVKGESLWAQFMKRKYGHPMEVCQTPRNILASHCWGSISTHIPFVLQHSRWIVRNGSKSFWTDKWLEEILWHPSCDNIHKSIREAMEDVEFLESNLTQEQKEQTTRITFTNDPDRLVFELNSNGQFTTAAVYEKKRVHGEKKSWSKYLWNKHLPPKIGFFMWRIMYNGFPTDNRVQERGFPLASKCFCCSTPNCETIDHIFCQGELATGLWDHFCNLLQVSVRRDTTLHLVEDWFREAHTSTQGGMLLALVGCIILWQIWLARNNVVYSNKGFYLPVLIGSVLSEVRPLMASFSGSSFPSMIECIRLQGMQVPIVIPPLRRGRMTHWSRPALGSIKLNTDGSCIGGVSAGGGVVRDWRGSVIMAYAINLGQGNSAKAEVMALLEGLKICHQKGIHVSEIEADSQFMVQCLKGVFMAPWNLEYELRQCGGFLTNNVKITHVFREANRLADGLANYGHLVIGLQILDTLGALPSNCRKIAWEDQLGLEHYRPP